MFESPHQYGYFGTNIRVKWKMFSLDFYQRCGTTLYMIEWTARLDKLTIAAWPQDLILLNISK